ncbi:DNA-binding transcriptional regulator, MarR family [Seinonella peptonophila]|uniref:DNA-binding transcriptional regulator, MarR family n=1 Tax=Seinonella peptonophila TaxID=112248 RepID=A0A1M4TD31_9BACL|nr:MarR family transcriptional regulator [Seinonella peptonophila]SHE42459.1 DNA-binding transcriptional regulator, MarR family [Seinonella peptonophila]
MEKIDQAFLKSFMKAWIQFHRAPHQLKKRADDCLKPSAFILLSILHGEEEPKMLSVSELSKILQVTSPTVTQLVTQLENNNLVERKINPSDRRAILVKLTEQGIQLVDQQRNKFLDSMKGLIEYLGVDESKKLTELMNRTVQYFQQQRS